MQRQIGFYAPKITTGFVDVLLGDRNGDIFFLHDVVAVHGLVYEHLVIFVSIFVQVIAFHWDQDILFKLCSVDPAIVDSDLRGSANVHGI